MSHYMVAVFTDGTEDYESLLAPYDENLSVPHYISREELIAKSKQDVEDYKEWRYSEYLDDPEGYVEKYANNPDHIKYITEEFPKKLLWTDDEHYQHEVGLYGEDKIQQDGSVYSNYNPNSKWDWYSEGGRFYDEVPLNDGTMCNDADMCDVNIDYVDDHSYKDALRFWELYVDGKEPQSDEDKEIVKFQFYTKEYYTDRYRDAEDYARESSCFSFYAAVLPDGQWLEPGQMGWFACSDATPDDEKSGEKRGERFFKRRKRRTGISR